MDSRIYEYLLGLEMGEMQKTGDIAAIPLFSPDESGLRYLILDEAIGRRWLTVTEVSTSSSVPGLKVINLADLPVLLYGEELVGAKQNCILNTTLLFFDIL